MHIDIHLISHILVRRLKKTKGIIQISIDYVGRQSYTEPSDYGGHQLPVQKRCIFPMVILTWRVQTPNVLRALTWSSQTPNHCPASSNQRWSTPRNTAGKIIHLSIYVTALFGNGRKLWNNWISHKIPYFFHNMFQMFFLSFFQT